MLPLFLFLFLVSPILISECNSEPLAPALYAFGDSLFENGNTPYAKYSPYGISFRTGNATGRVTGRVTDGKTFVDFIAEYLELPFPQPYFGLQRNRSKTGFSYASGGCGILPTTSPQLCFSPFRRDMDSQIKRFNTTVIEELTPHFGESLVGQHLANSIYLIWAGNNDYLLNFFFNESTGYNPEQFADLLIDRLTLQLKKLHELGARKFVLLEIGPLGCLPVYRIIHDKEDTWCDDDKNNNAKFFNTRLAAMVRILSDTYQDSYFTLAKLYSLTKQLFDNPTIYGMTNVSRPCCTLGKFNPSACKLSQTACEKPHEYLFFDGAHPTQAGNNILASKCFSGTGVCVPRNIQELAQVQTSLLTLHSAA